MHSEPVKARLLRLLWRLSGRRIGVDRFLSAFLKHRRYLAGYDVADVIPGFNESPIVIGQCPLGTWSTPLIDVVVVLKAATGFRSRRILELGSYRGHTARLLAENTGPDATITAVDIDERHGGAYRGLEIEKKIRRKTGRISLDLFGKDERFDFIFVDANHDFDSVMNDSEVAFSLLAPEGVILWHDYTQEYYFHGMCGVPEALNEFAKSRAICGVLGTTLAIYSSFPGWETANLEEKTKSKKSAASTLWQETRLPEEARLPGQKYLPSQ